MAEFKNPQMEPGSDKSFMLAIGVMFLVMIAMQFILPKPQPQPEQPAQQNPPAATKSAPAQTPGAPATAAASTPAQKKPAPGAAAAAAKPAPVETKQASAEATTVIENALYRIVFTNKGALVKSWVLKQHKDFEGKPLDLVHKEAAPLFGYPLSMFTYDAALREKLNSALYVMERKEPMASLSAPKTPDPAQKATGKRSTPQPSSTQAAAPRNDTPPGATTLTFEFADGATTVRKVFHFDDSYVVHIETRVTQNGMPVWAFPAWPAGIGDQHFAYAYASSRIDIAREDAVERKQPTSGWFLTGKTHIADGNTVNGPFHWAGTVDQYFAAIFLPDDPTSAVLVEMHNAIPRDPEEKDAEKRKSQTFSVLGAAVGSSRGETALRLFVGPKNLESLHSVHAYVPGEAPNASPSGPDLEGSVEFGMFGFIAKPLFLMLRFIQEHGITNWGWAIVLMTVLINLLLFPLRWTGMKSGLLMQKIQPEMTAINDKVKGLAFNDARKQAAMQEIQALQKREGVNPVAGCLPLLIQMPFLYAFYAMLSTTTELRNASWFWVHDLSSPDPWHLLPILLVVSMFVMQKITPTPGMDAMQARMMQVMMPVMLGMISWALPAGLGIYWVASNVMGYLMQLYVNNTKFAKEVRAQIAKRNEKKKR